MNLYQITSELQAVIDGILEGGIDSPEAQQALDEHLAGLDEALDQKAEDYAAVIMSLQARSDARAAEAKRIRELANADATVAQRLKERLKQAMETTGRVRIDTTRFRLTVANNGGKQPMLIEDASAVPAEFIVQVPEVDKDAVRAALEAGRPVPGCTLAPRGTSLRIK